MSDDDDDVDDELDGNIFSVLENYIYRLSIFSPAVNVFEVCSLYYNMQLYRFRLGLATDDSNISDINFASDLVIMFLYVSLYYD